ncbi:PREDICTED: dirigent protein 22-like [Nelumbo nucifera]|uniref:Dirigent protein n=2 Tax=Nelumbo nucifera TaxID=4432 RepID=A0A1U8BAY5_NELNU|nr:PREDICTED: dirigent protein 22-like [Nelumbo nucifera]DAD42552.1 TPA_asm: hypothetical protein HUJ06_000782 [Nelumbo nucifera]
MAGILLKPTSSLLIVLTCFFSSSVATSGAGKPHRFSRTLLPESVGLKQEETATHLHFYFHDILGGTNPTAVPIVEAAATKTSATAFGRVIMMDDPLTETLEATSKLVGRCQGFYAYASQSEFSFLMVMNFAFTEGEYNGSTLSVLGRNPVQSTVREMPVVGGTGLFRFARGYAQAETRTFDLKTGDAVVEYNVFVVH